jgi:hypothetical protein
MGAIEVTIFKYYQRVRTLDQTLVFFRNWVGGLNLKRRYLVATDSKRAGGAVLVAIPESQTSMSHIPLFVSTFINFLLAIWNLPAIIWCSSAEVADECAVR